jgi:hypothetical protein
MQKSGLQIFAGVFTILLGVTSLVLALADYTNAVTLFSKEMLGFTVPQGEPELWAAELMFSMIGVPQAYLDYLKLNSLLEVLHGALYLAAGILVLRRSALGFKLLLAAALVGLVFLAVQAAVALGNLSYLTVSAIWRSVLGGLFNLALLTALWFASRRARRAVLAG